MGKLHSKLLVFLLLPLFSSAQNFGGNPASIKWLQVNTANARVIFPKGLDSQAQRISNVAELLDSTTLYSIGNKIRKWNIVLLNQTTESNAYVRLAPVISELYMMPPQNNFLFGSLRWDDNLIIHEDRHMQQFSNFNHGFTKVFSFLFGQEGQLLANGLTVPNYFFEGDAVWQETLVSRQGRGRMPSFFNGMKSLWLGNKKYNWMQLRNGSLRNYTPDHYELGYPLLLYGYARYGEDFWRKVTTDAVDFKNVFYPFNKAIKRYSGKSYSQFTKDALAYCRSQVLGEVKADAFNFITAVEKNNVADYLYPQFVNDDTVIVTKQSYKEPASFYFLVNGKEKKLRVKDYVQDNYFSYNSGKVVYAAYQSDPRRANRNYSVIKLLDIYTNQQVQLTSHSKYFSPDINKESTEIIAVQVNEGGSSYLHRLDAKTGSLIRQLPNPDNYFFTQVKYIDTAAVVAAVRNPEGEMALLKIELATGTAEELMPFAYNILGYPNVKNGMVYFSMTDDYAADKNLKPADRIFAVSLTDKKLYRISDNINGVYYPAVNAKNELLFSAFTADGSRLVKMAVNGKMLQELPVAAKSVVNDIDALQRAGADVLDEVQDAQHPATKYSKASGLFNFHSARPFADDPEYGYTFYSDNIASTFHSEITYTYNRNEKSHAVGYDIVYGGLFPFLRGGIERSFSREINISTQSELKTFNYAATKLNAGFFIPLNFINGRTFKYLNFGAAYNAEYVPYSITNKNLQTKALNYLNTFFLFDNSSQKPKQLINPKWRQTFSVTYRDAFNLIDNHKLVADAALYFPGFFTNHSIEIDGAYQKRDTFPDFYSKTFSTSRGYEDLDQQRMYKVAVNYHFPLCYPDRGFGNLVFVQRLRLNAFYDYGSTLALFANGSQKEVKTRSTGAELFFDTKWWNALPVNFGIRYSRLLDKDLLNPGAVNRWEFILPIGLIPN